MWQLQGLLVLKAPKATYTDYNRLLMRLPLGFADSASAPSAARSRPSKLLLLLFLLNREFEFSSIDANVASSSDNNEGQLSSKCLNASDFITAANIKEFY